MLFNSLEFAVFFALVYALYVVSGHRFQNALLLVASYVFYGWWDVRFLGLLVISTVVDWLAALRIAAADSTPRRRRTWLVGSLAVNLGLLGTFKYYDFFVESLEAAARSLGWSVELLHLDVVLPVGISFYTFQSMSYTIDVYRRQLVPSRSVWDFALYVSFFPQLVAGPIERASSLLPQVLAPRRIDPEQFRAGLFLIGWGLFKKVMIADQCALLVDPVFDDHAAYGGLARLIAVYAFAFQIYADFSGYSDVARGLAKLLGFELMLNFDLPYFATNPPDFWRRWHISLSTWLRDYLYIPLGGNRLGNLVTYRNLALTMLLGGLWHGAGWTMILWGAYHAALLIVHRGLAGQKAPRADAPWMRRAKALGFFQLTCCGWLFFRAESVGQVVDFAAGLAHLGASAAEIERLSKLALLVVPLILVQCLQARRRDLLAPLNLAPAWRTAAAASIGLSVVLYWILFPIGLETGKPFIYFQF